MREVTLTHGGLAGHTAHTHLSKQPAAPQLLLRARRSTPALLAARCGAASVAGGMSAMRPEPVITLLVRR